MIRAVSRKSGPLVGEVRVPGDKSISHRAMMLGACAVGETRVRGLLDSTDVLATVAAMRLFGADIVREGAEWTIHGRGVGGLSEANQVVDMGNSGTSTRLAIGLVAAHPFSTIVTGDASLRRRPMRRVIEPLSRMGASFAARTGDLLPVTVHGRDDLVPITYRLPVASAQIKSAILLAGLNTSGTTTVIEPEPTRDHTERMLSRFGATVAVEAAESGGRAISLVGHPELAGCEIDVPGDFSSAAFLIVASLLVPGSRLRIVGVGDNPLRTALLSVLRAMGGTIVQGGHRVMGGEPVADIEVSASELRGIDVPPDLVPSLIDEFPILAVAAACAAGDTRLTGLAELRVKESDRLAAIARGLSACGVHVEEGPDWLLVRGTGAPPPDGASIAVALDHRIAMAFLVLGAVTGEPVTIDDASTIATSFPGFVHIAQDLGLRIATQEAT